MEHGKLAEELTTILDLETPPIGVCFVQAIPPGLDTFEGPVPSACSLWREAETRVFFASAETHFNCPVGAMIMGFDLPNEVQGQLEKIVMCEC